MTTEITRFENYRTPEGKPESSEWADLFKSFKHPVETEDKFAVPGWSPARFDPANRKKEHVKEISALVFDYDSGTPIQTARELWSEYTHLIHTTYSHTHECPRFRVVMPFSRPVTPEEYATIWESFYERANKAGHLIDRSCKDPSRFWFAPACKPGTEFLCTEFIINDINPDMFLGETMLGKTKYTSAALENAVNLIAGAVNGSRSNTLNKQAYSIAGFCAAGEIDPDLAYDALYDAALEVGLSRTEVTSTLRGAFLAGEKKPRYTDLYTNQYTPHGSQQRPAGSFDIKGADHIFAPVGEPTYVAEGVIRTGSVTLLGAYGGSGKTWLAVSLMLAVARGGMWLDKFPCNRGRTLLLDWESGDYEIRRRIQRVTTGLDLDGHPEGLEICTMPDTYMTAPDFEHRAKGLAIGRSLIVIDSLKAASPGVDENSADVRKNLDVLRRIAENTGCSFLVLVHAKKSNSNDRGGGDPREILRGSSAIYDAVDTAFVMRKVGNKNRIDQIKSRQGKAVDPFFVEVVDDEHGTGVFVRAYDVDQDVLNEDPHEKDCRMVIESLEKNNGQNSDELEARTRIAKKMILVALKALSDDGKIVTSQEDGNIVYYRAIPEHLRHSETRIKATPVVLESSKAVTP